MGNLFAHVTVSNALDAEKSLDFDALVDTGADYLVLPSAWRHKLGELELTDEVKVEIATQAIVRGEVCGPVRFQIEGFRPSCGEVLFIDMQPEGTDYKPLLGFIPLEQSQAGVDTLNKRLIRTRFVLKALDRSKKRFSVHSKLMMHLDVGFAGPKGTPSVAQGAALGGDTQ